MVIKNQRLDLKNNPKFLNLNFFLFGLTFKQFKVNPFTSTPSIPQMDKAFSEL